MSGGLLFTTVHSAKTADASHMPFRAVSGVAPKGPCARLGSRSVHTARKNLGNMCIGRLSLISSHANDIHVIQIYHKHLDYLAWVY